MEEVDRILVRALVALGTDIPEDVCSLQQFTAELIVEGVVRCLQRIDPPSVNGLSHLLPPGMSARFRIGMTLAQACQDLGYEGEIGYQTFLYSNELEVRRLLMFLVERLPRDGSESPHQPTAGKPAALQHAIAARIRQELATPWLPPSLRTPGLLATQGSRLMQEFHSQPLSLPGHCPAGKKIPTEVKEYYDRHCPPVTGQPSRPSLVAASLLERAAADLSAIQEWDTEWNGQGLASRLSPEEYRARKCQRLRKRIQEQFQRCVQHGPGGQTPAASDLSQLLQSFGAGWADTQAKGSRFTHTEKFTFTQEAEQLIRQMETVGGAYPSSRESEEGVRVEQEVSSCQQHLEEVTLRLEQMSGDLRHLLVSVAQVREELRGAVQAVAQKEELIGVKRRTLELLPDAETNLGKLQALIEGSAQRIVKLAHQWERHRAPLVAELRQLKEAVTNREHESSRRLEEIRALREKIKDSAEEAKRKEALYRQLVTEYGSLPQEVGRSAYTQRILEIVGNIRKQKEDISKILSDTKDSQKEVNSLSGKLERTFAVTDELVFKDAKKDEVVRKAYKYLAALHENCSQLIRTIEDSGTILREVRDLEEQIESETGKTALGSLEKILADYTAVRQDNAAIALKLQQA